MATTLPLSVSGPMTKTPLSTSLVGGTPKTVVTLFGDAESTTGDAASAPAVNVFEGFVFTDVGTSMIIGVAVTESVVVIDA